MDKEYLGLRIVLTSLLFGIGSFVVMFLNNIDLKSQIIYGMIPTIVITLIGVTIHVYYFNKTNPSKQQFPKGVEQ